MTKRKPNFDTEPTYLLDGEAAEPESDEPEELDFGALRLKPQEIEAHDGIEEHFRDTANKAAEARRYTAQRRLRKLYTRDRPADCCRGPGKTLRRR
jgi:hypothetical protein